ncbi:hypothetical protein H5410_058434 [Solanum commersonii]|uniref:Uncharacterized protein n=1 Tax=Solanum commersonii TaxID=4109 RepID=A0A9J5WT37_SOLCO|nr:hypothetical protein H5410_058434 [Solanum commersonii]
MRTCTSAMRAFHASANHKKVPLNGVELGKQCLYICLFKRMKKVKQNPDYRAIQEYKMLTEAGAHVVMAVRSTNRAQELIWKWQEEWSGKGLPLNIEVMELDLHSLDSVTRFAEAWNARMAPVQEATNLLLVSEPFETKKFGGHLYMFRAQKISDKASVFFHLRTMFPCVLDASLRIWTIHSMDLLLKEVLVMVFLFLSVHLYQIPVVPEIFLMSKDLKPTAKYMIFSIV